jgi:WXXGXW repeat (2 copies)
MYNRSTRTLMFALVVSCMVLGMSSASFSQIGLMITVAPPPLPVYEQPICPGDGYLWTPGYWAWGDDFDDYYWVPGTWVMAPEVGFLWTPAYWGWGGDRFVFYDGYWGPHIGFYGGVNYGFGYFGDGFEGGRWDNGHFFYNRSVTNVNVTNIHNVYNTTVVNRNVENHVSYNGGSGGIDARPTSEQEAAAHDRHVPPVAAQTQHAQEARTDTQQRASVNMGKPAVAATARPGEFKGGDVVQAREAGGAYKPPANRAANQARPENNAARPEDNTARPADNAARPATAGHVRDLPAAQRPAAPNTGNAKQDKKYQQQQDKQYAQQQKERQKLQQQQEKEDQKMAKQNSDAKKQQVEQQHQQQTQQLQQRHQQQQQDLQQRQAPAAHAGRPPR